MVKLLNRFHFILLAIIALNILIFLEYAELASILPRTFIGLTFIAAFFEFNIRRRKIEMNFVLKFYLFVLILYIVSFPFTNNLLEAINLIEAQLYSIILIVSLSVIFQNKKIYDAMPKFFLFISLFIVCFNFYELLNPTTFMKVVGRSSGTYINPNSCGIALLSFSLIAINHIKSERNRLIFMMVINLGVFLTLSRAAILISILISTIYFIKINKKARYFIAVILVLIYLLPNLLTTMTNQFNDTGGNARLSKILNIFNRSQNLNDEISDDVRARIMINSFDMVLEKPITGNGLGAFRNIQDYGDINETHNMFLVFAVDYGFIGMLIYPIFIFFLFNRRSDKFRILFIITFLIWGLSSHNILHQYFLILFFTYYVYRNKNENMLRD
jgi:hypothetical protein